MISEHRTAIFLFDTFMILSFSVSYSSPTWSSSTRSSKFISPRTEIGYYEEIADLILIITLSVFKEILFVAIPVPGELKTFEAAV